MTQHISLTVLSINAALQVHPRVVALGLLIGLLLIDWHVALSTAGVFGTSYIVVAITARAQLLKNSERLLWQIHRGTGIAGRSWRYS